MTEYIDRQAAIEAVHRTIFNFFNVCEDDEESPMTYEDERLLEINKAITGAIKELLSADVAPVRRGRWIEKTDCNLDTYYDCSECGESWTTLEGTPWDNGMNYCPNCGAKMEGEQDG